jgi:DNA-binding transcriptional MerR regulator
MVVVTKEDTSMEYTINKLAKLAGVTTRTLRWYDTCNLLKPCRISSSGYRIYGQQEVDRLQQILFYRELGMDLSKIQNLLSDSSFDPLTAMEQHLSALLEKRQQLDSLIANATQSIAAMKGENTMTDTEKFEGFKQKLVSENENRYGEEIRAKYGEDTINFSNAMLKNMTMEQFSELETVTKELNETLQAAYTQGNPAGELAQKAAALHKRWLCYYLPNYSADVHLGITQMYVDDPRFTAYYDNIAPGCAPFLRDAVKVYLNAIPRQ